MISAVKLICLQLLFLSWVVSCSSDLRSRIAKPGCDDTCGNVSIPYPFGIGSRCSLNQWYTIDCNQTLPLLPYLRELGVQVVRIFLQNQTIIVKERADIFCPFSSTTIAVYGRYFNTSGSPFLFAGAENKLMLFGCGNARLRMTNHSSKVLAGCSTTCSGAEVADGCYGTSCCQTSIPSYHNLYALMLLMTRQESGLLKCSSVFFAERNWLPTNYSNPLEQNLSVPVVMSWTLKRFDISSSCTLRSYPLQMESGEIIDNWRCSCDYSFLSKFPDWNPYIDGECTGNPVYKLKAVVFGIATGTGMLILAAITFGSYKLLKRRRKKRMREKFFKRNGGLLLQRQLSVDDRLMERTRIFTAKELDKATDKFNENRILGRGGQGIVYKGMLTDGRIVAIKRSSALSVDDDRENQVEQFINEVVLLSQVVHKNVVRLLGCCLEAEVPLLVYEFIPNGTLFALIHNNKENDEFLTWNIRLRIATEVAGALAYLHSAISVPIYHRDIKSGNILLDEKYLAKVSDFGTSRPILDDKSHVTTVVKGTFGYLDPEYFQSNQFTDKSDVYSFGVVLVELLTGQKAVPSTVRRQGGGSLATRFLESMEKNDVKRILDVQVLNESNEEEVVNVAKLARRCLNLNGRNRPTMEEVAMELVGIKMATSGGNRPSTTVQETFELQGFTAHELESSSSGRSSMWTNSSVSNSRPLLLNNTI